MRRTAITKRCKYFLAVYFLLLSVCCFASGTYSMTVGESKGFSPASGYSHIMSTSIQYIDYNAFDVKTTKHTNSFYVNHAYETYTYYSYTLTALKTGTYTVKFSVLYQNLNNYHEVISSYTINVYDVKSISITSDVSLPIGEKFTYNPIIEDSQASTTLSWSSDNNQIVIVDGPTITAKSIGSAIVTCMAHNGVKTTSHVTVTPAYVSSINLNYEEFDLPLFDRLHLKAEVQPSYASNPTIRWSSSNNNVAIVREDGVVIGINCGYALVSAKAVDNSGVESSCLIHVVDTPAVGRIISISDTESGKIELKIDKDISIRAISNPGWQLRCIMIDDEVFSITQDDWIPVSNLDNIEEITIIWENKTTSDSELLLNAQNLFTIHDRIIEIVDKRQTHLEVCDIQGRTIYDGPCLNVHLPSSGYYLINYANRIFKIFVP